VPVLAKGKTDTGRCWVYVRDDAPFGGAGPPAAIFYYSRDRKGEHPQTHLANYFGILQADAYDGYNKLYAAERKPGPILEAACWAHARRPFFVMADIDANVRRKAAGKKEIPLSPIAMEIVRRIDALFEIERSINSKSAQERLAVRRASSRPLVDALESYMREQLAKLSRGHDLAKAMQYMRKRRFRPIAAGMEEQLAIRCDKALHAFGAKLCQRLGQRADKRSGGWRRRRRFEGPGHQLVDARLRMAIGDCLERRLHPGIGIDAVQLACRKKRSETCPGTPTFIGAGIIVLGF
jgi:hypothetical protein